MKRSTRNATEVSLCDAERIIGYVVLKKRAEGLYVLENQSAIDYQHQGLENRFGWGIEVHAAYRGRNIGHALLSLGIGVILLEVNETENFEVRATGIIKNVDFYRSFGFEIRYEGVSPVGKYVKRTVPEIRIR